MRNWIERVIAHSKTNRPLAIDMTSSPTASLMPHLAAARRLLGQICPRRLEQQGPPKLMGLTGTMSGRCIADNKRVHRALRCLSSDRISVRKRRGGVHFV